MTTTELIDGQMLLIPLNGRINAETMQSNQFSKASFG
jgi:hypothetical protein